MARILVIDDDHSLVHRVSTVLRSRGHEVIEIYDGRCACSTALHGNARPNLILLGGALSNSTRPPVLTSLRRGGFSGPILVWHESRDENDIVRCFMSGADQYIPLPFGMRELVARVDASLARFQAASGRNDLENGNRAAAPNEMYVFGGIEVDLMSREVRRDGAGIKLSPLEFNLLAALLRRKGAVTTRTDLLREVWNYGPGVRSRTLDTHILNLRGKLEAEPRAPRHILTVRGVGYRLRIES